MCGISGFLDLKKRGAPSAEKAEAMMRALQHRGPDEMQCITHDHLALAFNRLAIVDPETGMQPIYNEDRSVVVICNGEIYNHRELRAQLTSKGHRFQTGSDVEVLVHLYESYGTTFMHQLNGQFAFFLYDFKREFFMGCRDHFGIAPFYYAVVDGYLVFGSEIKAILAGGFITPRIDLMGLDQVLFLPGLVSPQTMFEGIHSLPPASVISGVSGNYKVRSYWEFRYTHFQSEPAPGAARVCLEQMEEVLIKAVERRLQADVPVGLYLSGGLDSSLLAAIASRSSDDPLKSFGVCFDDPLLSEKVHQQTMARAFSLLHTSLLYDHENTADALRKVIFHTEVPIRESLNVALFRLSEATRNHKVKSVLSGQGADELFGGYVGYQMDGNRMAGASAQLQEQQLRNLLWGDRSFYYERDYLAARHQLGTIYSPDTREALGRLGALGAPLIPPGALKGSDPFQQRSYVDLKLRLPDHLLSDLGDKMAYANGVECRYPYLDQEFVRLLLQTPTSVKFDALSGKKGLRNMAENKIPGSILNRDKFGFSAPGSPQFLQSKNPYIADLLSFSTLKKQNIFDPNRIEKMKQKYARPGFKLMAPFEDDVLMVVITTGILIELYNLH